MPVSDYSTTPGSNTSISGINIAEACPAGNLNNAIRQLMADLKAAGYAPLAGAAFTGDVTVANNKSLALTDAAGNKPFFICQADNNLVFYGTDGGGAQRAIFSIPMASGSSPLDFNVPITSTNIADTVGYKGLPANSQTGAYTLVIGDMGKHISITTGGVVIPANASVGFPIGTAIVVYNNSASSQTITIMTDTLRLAGTGTTGARTLAGYGLATLVKVGTTTWVASGSGVS